VSCASIARFSCISQVILAEHAWQARVALFLFLYLSWGSCLGSLAWLGHPGRGSIDGMGAFHVDNGLVFHEFIYCFNSYSYALPFHILLAKPCSSFLFYIIPSKGKTKDGGDPSGA